MVWQVSGMGMSTMTVQYGFLADKSPLSPSKMVADRQAHSEVSLQPQWSNEQKSSLNVQGQNLAV